MKYRRCVSMWSLDTAYHGRVPDGFDASSIPLDDGTVFVPRGDVSLWYPNGYQDQKGPRHDVISEQEFQAQWIDEADVPPGTKQRAAIDAMPDYDAWVNSTYDSKGEN